MKAVDRSELPGWLRSSSVGWAGAVLGGLVIVVAAAFLLHEAQVLEAEEVHRAELYARVLRDHADRTFDTIDIAMESLAEGAARATRSNTLGDFGEAMTRNLSGLPFLRSFSLVNRDGLVVASSSRGNLGAVVAPGAIRLPAAGAMDALGTSVAGRDLADARVGQTPGGSGARSFVPLVRSIPLPSGEVLYLVAVLNPDFFANEHELTLNDSTRGAGILDLDAVLIAATSNIRSLPGAVIRGHAFFDRYLPGRENGSMVGSGIDGTKVVTAFRTLRKRPVVVIVERPYTHVLGALRETVIGTVGAATAALLLIAGTMVMGWRSLRSHEAVSTRLDSTRTAIATSERDLRSIVESVHELIFKADADGRIVFVNGRWSELTRRPSSEVMGKRITDLCIDSERHACQSLFARPDIQDEALLIHIRNDVGALLTLDLSVSRVVDADGRTSGYAGFAVDVSAREAARQALQSQLKFTARLLEITPMPIFVKDEARRFVTVNRAWLELMDLSLSDVLGRTSADLFGADGATHNDQDARLLLTEDRISYDNRLLVAGRPPRDTVVTKVRFTRADGTAAGIVGSIMDVTEFRDAERKIARARDAAELANGAKSEFIANISHELRTPLQSIIGFSEIGRDLSGGLPDFLDLFAEIHAGGQRMLTLVNGLLDVAQTETPAGTGRSERVDIVALVRELVTEIQPAALARDQEIRLLGLDRPFEVEVDPIRLRQAVRNVLANAVRYSPTGGRIEVSFADRGRAGLELAVRDHGPGIPEDELELIFEAFVQSSRTRDGSGGTGLGLTLARKIMSAHGGRIVASAAEGGGTRFTLSLPAAVVSGEPVEPSPRQDAARALVAPEAV